MAATNQDKSLLMEAIDELFLYPVWKKFTFKENTRYQTTLTMEATPHPYITYFQCRLYHSNDTVIIETEVGRLGELVNHVHEDEMRASLTSARDAALSLVHTILQETIDEVDMRDGVLHKISPLICPEVDRLVQSFHRKGKQPNLRTWMFYDFLEENPHITEDDIGKTIERYYPYLTLCY